MFKSQSSCIIIEYYTTNIFKALNVIYIYDTKIFLDNNSPFKFFSEQKFYKNWTKLIAAKENNMEKH